jgi:hypothetical protein
MQQELRSRSQRQDRRYILWCLDYDDVSWSRFKRYSQSIITSFTGQRNRRGNTTTNSSAFIIFLPLMRHFILYFYIPLVDESLLLQAATAYCNGEYTSIRACADVFSVSYSTLSYRLSGRVSRSIVCESSQILLIAKEKALVKWIT